MRDDLSVWIEVDLGRIRRNVENLKALLSPSTKLLAVVKANGYGHGDSAVAKAAVDGGADWIGVARVEEGVAVRESGISKPILVLAEPPHGAIAKAVESALTLTVYTEPTARAIARAGASTHQRFAEVHVKVDTGMHRYGVAPESMQSLIDTISGLRGIEISGIWSHFAVADDVLNPYTKKQHEVFLEALQTLGDKASGWMKHMANSAATMSFPEAHHDIVRTGISIYGISPSPDLSDAVALSPAMTLKSRVGQMKKLRVDEPISYGQRYRMPRDGWVATIPCGYADGMRRALSNSGEVLIRGRRYTISGTITMDHLLVDVGDDEVEVGDEVVLLGPQGAEEITVEQIASKLETIPYEVVCGMNARVQRIYVDRG